MSSEKAEIEVSDLLELTIIIMLQMGTEVPGLTLLSGLKKQLFPKKSLKYSPSSCKNSHIWLQSICPFQDL